MIYGKVTVEKLVNFLAIEFCVCGSKFLRNDECLLDKL